MARQPGALPGMRHLNGHLLCAIDVETTGLIAGHHDIWQIAILPLDAAIKPLKTVLPFYMNIKIKFPERIDPKAIKISKVEFARKQQHAIESFTCADLFDTWFDKLRLPMYKKIVPLAHNWVFDREFIIEWLGRASFELAFYPVYRDTMSIAAFDSDLQDFRSDPIVFKKQNLSFVSYQLGVQNEKPHDALQDAITTAECYRRLLLRF